MSTQNTAHHSTAIRQIYWGILVLLVVNNLGGIALNFQVFLISISGVIGIPGAVLTAHYIIGMARRYTPTMYILPHLVGIVYNGVLFYLFKTDSMLAHWINGGALWPAINLALSLVAFLLSTLHYFLYKQDEN